MAGAAIEVSGLTKRFGQVLALDHVDLAVPAGTVFGLLGPNGAGKTTTVRILTTIIPPDAGEARVLGRDVVRDAYAVRAHIGRSQAAQRADELLDRFDLTDAADRPARTYSGGMRRRLDLAAALVHRPPVLFLDEPTSGLDPRSRVELWRLIAELVSEGMTLLLTTQYLEEADRLADRIAVVDGGRVIAEGTASELKASLGTTSVEVGFGADEEATTAEALLGPFGTDRPHREGTTVRLEVKDGPQVLMRVLSALDDQGIAPVSVALREPSLDDVFFALTGHPAQKGEDNADRNGLVAAGDVK